MLRVLNPAELDASAIVSGTLSRDTSGNAATATRLKTARNLRVSLASAYDSSSPVTFDGSAGKALPVTGRLAQANGGTGAAALYKLVTATKAYTVAAGSSVTVAMEPSVPNGYTAVAVKRASSGNAGVSIASINVSSNKDWDVALKSTNPASVSATATIVALCLPTA